MIVDIPWSAAQERRRQAEFDAQLTPHLFPYWAGSPTAMLVATRDELAAKLPAEGVTIACLDLEIAYRLIDDGVPSCQWCAGSGCKSCGFTGRGDTHEPGCDCIGCAP